jgi:hypothetical protein
VELPAKAHRGEIRSASPAQQHDARRLQTLSAELAGRSDIDWTIHSHVTLSRLGLSRILYYDHVYRHVLDVPGVILEFGVQWGATLSLLTNLRGMHEPYNLYRRIIGFDTFEGFPSVGPEDGVAPALGDYSVPPEHVELLEEVLDIHESASPISHVRKHELVVGDVVQTLPVWLTDNPQAVVAMAIFDLDLYEPTREALQLIIPRLTRGSVLVFDELNSRDFPGETLALQEVLGLDRLRLHQYSHQPRCAWGIWGD